MHHSHRITALAAAALLFGAAAPATTLTFDELPFQPVDGLSFSGVTFGFTVGGASSLDANYGSGGPGTITFIDDPSLEGTTEGILTLDFAEPTCDLSFGLALNTIGPVTPGAVVELYDGNGILFGSEAVDLDSIVFFSEGLFSWTGTTPLARAVIGFDFTAADRFVIDNLSYNNVVCVPEGGGIWGGIGLGTVASLAWARRRNQRR